MVLIFAPDEIINEAAVCRRSCTRRCLGNDESSAWHAVTATDNQWTGLGGDMGPPRRGAGQIKLRVSRPSLL